MPPELDQEEKDKDPGVNPESGNDDSDSRYQKLLKEKKNATERLRQLEEENKKLKDAELRTKENYKQLAEDKEKEANEWKQKFQDKDKMIADAAKKSALKSELIKQGCDPNYIEKALKFADISKLNYDDESGIVIGADEEARGLARELSPLFKSSDPGINNDAPPADPPSELNLEDWKKLPYDERQRRREELNKTLGLNMRK